MFEVINSHLEEIMSSLVLDSLLLKKGKYFVVSAHREENISSDHHFYGLINVLNTLAEHYQLPIIISAHPRTRKRIEETGVKLNPLINLMKPLGFFDYVKLQLDAKAVLSDSGTISEEASILNFPALNLRDAHERPEAMEEAAVMMVGLNPERIMQALSLLEEQQTAKERNFRPVADYSAPNVSDKVVRIILSYTDYVKRVVYGCYE